MSDLEAIRQRAKQYARDRDWEQFHYAKNLAMALSVEAAELMEHFQWLGPEQGDAVSGEQKQAVADEIADVQVYLVLLADRLGINIADAVSAKMDKNEIKYPADKVRGSAKKYSEYD